MSHAILAMRKKIIASVKEFFQRPNVVYVTILTAILGVFLISVVPLLPHITGHPDEYQFFFNAWSIMGGKELHNYMHIAVTEYLLAFFLSFVNLVTKTGVNFPQGDPNVVAYFFGRIFGLLLMLMTYLVSIYILQKGQSRLRPRVVFFTVLFFGSMAMFERFLRVNSDSMGIFVNCNFLLVSLLFHQRRARPLHFFLLNLLFVFLVSFTNLKALYVALPIFAINTLFPFIWYEDHKVKDGRIPSFYRMLLYSFGVLFGTVILWYLGIPKPANHKTFWYNLKQTTVASVNFDYQYPGLAHKSWAVYLYDLFAYQIGFFTLLAIVIFLAIAIYYGRKLFWRGLKQKFVSQININNWKTGNLFASTELILVVLAISYYIGVSSAVIHWSRWNAPFGFIVLMLVSVLLEYAFNILITTPKFDRSKLYVILPFCFFVSWSMIFVLMNTVRLTDYPTEGGMKLTSDDVRAFLRQENIYGEDIPKRVGWYYGSQDTIPNIDITKLGKPGTPDIDFLIWPQWFTGAVYMKDNVDLELSNEREFIKSYTDGYVWRFPSPISHYIHYTKWFAQGYLGITWLPELEGMTENQYPIFRMKKPLAPIKMHWEVPFAGMEHYYSPKSHIFTINNLHDGYSFPPCHGSPTTLEVDTGLPSNYPEDPLLVSRITDMYCHSLGIRIALKGRYAIQIEGLPDDPDHVQKIYSAYPISFDPKTKTIHYTFETTAITFAAGVATKEKYLPDLKYIIDYDPIDIATPSATPKPLPIEPESQ